MVLWWSWSSMVVSCVQRHYYVDSFDPLDLCSTIEYFLKWHSKLLSSRLLDETFSLRGKKASCSNKVVSSYFDYNSCRKRLLLRPSCCPGQPSSPLSCLRYLHQWLTPNPSLCTLKCVELNTNSSGRRRYRILQVTFGKVHVRRGGGGG